MAAARLTAEQLVAWFNARQPSTGTFAATVPVATLAQYFVEEGAAEGVSGDVATALTCTVPPLAKPCVDPRFQLVTPKGKSPTWNEMGNGNWASASTYSSSILGLYAEALTFSGARTVSTSRVIDP